MTNCKGYAISFVVALMVMTGCSGVGSGSDNGGLPDATLPTVLSTFPGNNSMDAATNTNIIARFSEAMDPSTMTTAVLTVTGPGGSPVTGTISYDGTNHVVDFLPSNVLAFSTLFTARISIGARDLAGNALASQYAWSFTTGTAPDTVPPTVTSMNPADLSTNAPINQAITATFNEPMDSATFTSTTFTLMQGGVTPVPGSVTCTGATAMFTPSGNLASNVAFTARITAGVKDLAGIAMASDVVWGFQTGSTQAMGPAPVILGTAGYFVILAKSSVSVTGVTSVVGDIGLSPAAGSYLTGFSETMDSSNQYSTSAIVTGFIYAADYAPPTPVNMTTAVLDMETAYTDAAGRTLPDATELGAGNIDGMTLPPGLYKWGTGLDIPNGVTLSGGANDVWIFQIAQDLTVGNGAIITLTGGQARNVFWQVAGQTTLGTTSDFKGVLLCQTAIILNTGAVMNGRALAQTAVTLDANAVTAP